MPLEIVAIKPAPKAKQKAAPAEQPHAEVVMQPEQEDVSARPSQPRARKQSQQPRQQAIARLILQVRVRGSKEAPEFHFSHNGVKLAAMVNRPGVLAWGSENLGFEGDRRVVGWVRTNEAGVICLEVRSVYPPDRESPHPLGVAIAGYAEPDSEMVLIRPRKVTGLEPFEVRCTGLAVPASGHWFIEGDLGDRGEIVTTAARRRDPEAPQKKATAKSE